ITHLRREQMRTRFDVQRPESQPTLSVELNIPGVHNVLNAAAVVAEHAAALELAGALLEKFGGDTLAEIKERVRLWRKKTAKFTGR
ncbi:MAG: hypothetical protein RQ748_07035, partial [Elusimicrobiales bacterium]|nr:hypothetical protein [Elusimicrobiales bacterium]